MNSHYATIDEPAAPEYVLAVLQDMHRQQCQIDPEADPGAVLSFDTTVAEWRNACDMMQWQHLGRAYNRLWGIECSDDEWRDVLEPASRRRLADVCRFIAARVRRPAIRSSMLLGVSCVPAGVFLTIRSLLREAGASEDEILPSTLLAPYTRRFTNVFLGPISRLSPGTMPPVRIRTPIYNAAVLGLLGGLVCLIVGAGVRGNAIAVLGALLCVICYLLTWYSARWLLPASVEFGALRTFRDLAVVLSRGADRAPSEQGTSP